MEKIKFFDCNARIGVSNSPLVYGADTADELLNSMDYFGIEGAVVYHIEAVFSPVNGNEMLIKEIAGKPRLTGCAVLTPSYGGEYGEIAEYFKFLYSSGIRAVRLFPAANNYRPVPLYTDTIINEAQKHKMPVIIDEIDVYHPGLPVSTWTYSPSYEDIYELSAAYPAVNFIIISPGMQTQRKQNAIMRKCGNVFLECSGYGYKNIEHVCENNFDKYVYGSGFPVLDPGTPMSAVLYADIPDAAKIRIAYENLAEIIDGEARDE